MSNFWTVSRTETSTTLISNRSSKALSTMLNTQETRILRTENRMAIWAIITVGVVMLALTLLIGVIALANDRAATLVDESVRSMATKTPMIVPQMVMQAADRNPDAIIAGQKIFRTVCIACHGANAQGIKGLGKPLVGSEFFNSRTDDQMLQFLLTGRPVNDPLNTTGVVMPAKGGRTNLTDEDLLNVIAYIRSLNAVAQ